MPRSCVQVSVFITESGAKIIGFSVADQAAFKDFPAAARIKLRLNENKFSEVLDFGTLGSPKTSVELKNPAFAAPSCQLRIVTADGEKKGLLLGSTDSWTLRTDEKETGQGASQGILYFQKKNIAPRTWKLDIRDTEHPIVYIDEKVPDSRTWARNDAVFVTTVFPSIIQQVFSVILAHASPNEIEWMKDWLKWADALVPGNELPGISDEPSKKDAWLDGVLDAFCAKHKLLDRLVGHVSIDKVPA